MLWRPDLQPYLELDQVPCKLDEEIIINVQEEAPIQLSCKGLSPFWNPSFSPLANRC